MSGPGDEIYSDRFDRAGLANVISVPELAANWRASLQRTLARVA